MNYYRIPREGRTHAQYSEYVSGLPFVFGTDSRALALDYYREVVAVDGTIAGFDLALPDPDEFAARKLVFAAQCDKDCDDIYFDVMGFRDIEYINAEAEAKDYIAAGYTGTVPPLIAAYAAGSGMSAQQAADYTMALANAWRPAMQTIRQERTSAKTAAQAAANDADFDAVVAGWAGFVAAMRGQLGI
ncbi:MAG: hypothetical protein ACOY4U_10615 [Pseudomonadota bacterium]